MTEQPSRNSAINAVNLDWTRDRTSITLTPYQQYIRDVDWSETALGPMQSWSRELRQTVLFMMAEVNPVILYWGDHYAMIYNEAYIPLVGNRHPELQGQNASDAFPEFWDYFAQIITEQHATGQTHVGQASMVMMTRHGFLEETYFNWNMIPVIGDNGMMLGCYGRPTESTIEVINSRRMACIQSLSQQISSAQSFEHLWTTTMDCLSSNDKDIPMAMVYTVTSIEEHTGAEQHPSQVTLKGKLEALLGISQAHPCAENEIDIREGVEGLVPSILRAYDKGTVYLTSLRNAGLEDFFADVEWRGFGDPVEQLAFLPIKSDGKVAGILIAGLNPRLSFTSRYQDFITMIGEVLSPQISKIKLAEEVRARDTIAQKAMSNFQRSEIKFARFATRAPIGLTLADRDGKVMYANEAWYNFCGLNHEETEFSSWVETVWEEDLPIVNEWWHKLIHLKQSGNFQIRTKQPFVSGHMSMPYRTGIVGVYPDLDDEGNVATVMGLVTDISELKWTEEQLRLRQKELEESEKKYRDFAERAPIGVVRTDANGRVLFANDTWCSFYNVKKDHIFENAEPWLASLHKDDVPLAQNFFQEISNKENPTGVEVRLNRLKPSLDPSRISPPMEFWLLSTGFAEFNSDGSIDNMMFWVTDISDQKAAEKVLTDKMEEAIHLKDTQERFVDMISHEIRNPLSAILHCGEEIVDALKQLTMIAGSPSHPGHVMNGVSMGTSNETHISNALEAANTILYCVQHQKQIVDDVLTLSKLDADLLVVSPIPVQPTELIKSALKMFEPELKASNIELVFEIKSSLKELDVDWLLLDPNRFLQIVINLITNAIKFTRGSTTRRILISVNVRTERPPREHHGIDYIPPRLANRNNSNTAKEVHDEPESVDDVYLCLSVADTGKGLEQSELTTLFSRFSQASPKTHVEYGGSGLGLFIARLITEMLGGEIGVGSEPGKGATFAFYVHTQKTKPPQHASVAVHPEPPVIPAPGDLVPHRQDDPQPTSSRVNSRSPQQNLDSMTRRRRVLVVEDNIVNQKVLCKQLKNRGFEVEAANHGREALDALGKVCNKANSWFDVILCDIEMPVMDGIECVTEIRRLEKEGVFTRHMSIIGVTANVRSTQVNAAIEAGMDGITTKPYRIDELIAHIDRVAKELKSAENNAIS